MDSKLFFIFFFHLLNSVLARSVCPKFKWLNGSTSIDGVPLLNIKFPDEMEDDFAILKKLENSSPSQPDCILQGHLMLDKNVVVKITSGCQFGNSFKIELNSSRLLYSFFDVADGKVNPEFSREEQTAYTERPHHRNHLSFPVNGYVLKLVAFYDVSFRSTFRRTSKSMVETIIEETQSMFYLPSLTVKMTLQLEEVKEVEDIITPQNIKLHEMIEGEEETNNLFLFFTAAGEANVCGTPRLEKVCSTLRNERTALVHWQGDVTKTSKSVAHEIGHLLGMSDDFELNSDASKIKPRRDTKNNLCVNINGIMDYNSDGTVWSSCSLQDFVNYHTTVKERDSKFCLTENKLKPKGYTKLAIALGESYSSQFPHKDIEVLDLSSTKSRCENLPDFPYGNGWPVGKLGPGDKPIICGGRINNSACHVLEDGTWKVGPSFNQGRHRFGMTRSPYPNDGSSLFATGGRSSKNTTEVLTEAGWKPSVPLPMLGHCMVMINSTTVMAIGGFEIQEEYSQLTANTSILNTETNVWTPGPALNHPRHDHCCAMIKTDAESDKKTVIVAGGRMKVMLSSTEVLDLETFEWSSGPELPYKVEHAAMVEEDFGGVVITAGKHELSDRPRYHLYRLAHAESRWEPILQWLQSGVRYAHTAFFIPDELTNCTDVVD